MKNPWSNTTTCLLKCVDGAPTKKQKLDDSKTEKKESEEAAEKEEEEEDETEAEETEKAEEENAEEPGLLEKCNMAWFRGVRQFPHPSK